MRSLWIKVVLAALVAVGVLAATASGSHFRYGNYTWVNTGGTTTEFTVTNAFRRDGYPGTGVGGFAGPGDIIQENIGGTMFNFGDGNVTPTLNYLVTSVDVANNWLFAVALDPADLPAQDTTIDHTYAAAGDVTAFTDSSARIGNLINAPNGQYRVETIVNVGGTNHPPVSTMPPIINCPISALCTFQVPANDADGDGLAYRLSTSAESGIGNQPGPPNATNAASISTSGLYTWDTTGATLAGLGPTYYATQVTVEDRTNGNVPISKVAVDFIIQLVAQVGTPPAFVSPTPTCGSTVNGTVGSPVSFTVAASDADQGDNVTLTAAGVPIGATLTPSLPASGNPVQTAFSWTPGGAGSSVVIFAATDTSGNQALCSVTISVSLAPQTATLNVTKFYDANTNGTQDPGEPDISDWKVQVKNGSTHVGTTPFTASGLAPDDYTASEFSPIQANWIATTPTSVPVNLAGGDDKTVSFGNVCTGDGGGLTIGFWGNKNGQALFGAGDLALLVSLNLRNADGSPFNPGSYAAFKTWLSKATATNMAYMLSAQLAAMELNVLNGFVSGSALVYAPGTQSANGLGFATVDALIAEANTELGAHGLTKSGSPDRSYQQTLMNALDKANQDNSTVFVQSGPCAFSFTPSGPCEAGTGNAGAGYNAIPTGVEHCSPPSEGFEANSDNEFGDRVTLNTAGGTKLVSMTVDFQSYGCETSGHWNTGNCLTPAVAGTFTVPGGITAKIYSVVGGNLGAVIATSNVLNPAIPFRPSAISDASCPNAPADPNALNSRFKDAVSGQCVYSLSVPLTFTFPAGTTFTSGQEVVWTVQFNTTHAGYSPIGEAPTCFQDVKNDPNKPGCGYDSLNVGAKSYPNAPYAGTDVDPNSVYRSHGNANYGAPFVALSPDSVGWAGFRPLGQIVLGP